MHNYIIHLHVIYSFIFILSSSIHILCLAEYWPPPAPSGKWWVQSPTWAPREEPSTKTRHRCWPHMCQPGCCVQRGRYSKMETNFQTPRISRMGIHEPHANWLSHQPKNLEIIRNHPKSSEIITDEAPTSAAAGRRPGPWRCAGSERCASASPPADCWIADPQFANPSTMVVDQAPWEGFDQFQCDSI